MDGWIEDGRTDEWVHGWRDGLMDRLTVCVDWMGGWMDSLDGRMNGSTTEMDRSIDRPFRLPARRR